VTTHTLRRGVAWTVAATVAATVFFIAALNNDVYNATTPPHLVWHVVLRKFYSVVAFTLLAYLISRAIAERGAKPTPFKLLASIAAYSATIEVAQYLRGTREGLGWNAVDIACGALAGALAGVLAAVVRRS